MPKIKKDYLITKRNVLNEMRSTNMTLQELRLFSLYLSKINAMDKNTRIVRFSMTEFQSIMELSQVNIPYLKEVARSLIKKEIDIPKESGGFTLFHLFSVFEVEMDEKGDWYIQIDAHDRALPLLFDFQDKFFRYRLWNALRLKSKNQLRMYEVLKQYEGIGYRVISVDDLKGMLGIGENEYTKYKDFRRDVLEVCRQALAEHTDITFTYEVSKRGGRGGKIHSLEFTIAKNKTYKDKLGLENFIDLHTRHIIDGEYTQHTDTLPVQPNLNDIDLDEAMELVDEGKITRRDEMIITLRGVMKNEFTFEQTQELYDKVIMEFPTLMGNDLILHFQAKYNIAKRVDSEGKITRSPFAYVRSIIAKP
jgi:hypothetical protein